MNVSIKQEVDDDLNSSSSFESQVKEDESERKVECLDLKPPLCCFCKQPIVDRYMSKVCEKFWHEACLKCCCCGVELKNACYNKDGNLYCREDYSRYYGCKCYLCEQLIMPSELVMKALDNIYHVECFRCDECGDSLVKGDEFILKDDKLYCSADFNVADGRSDIDLLSSDEYESMSTASPKSPKYDGKGSSPTSSSCKRPRTILTSQQREDFKAAFEITPKPCRKVREQLSNETGLSVRVVQVWFQNQRAKLKKIQKKTDEGPKTEKIRKINQGKVSKRRQKPKSPEHGKSDFNLPISINMTRHFTNLLGVHENYTTNANLSYYGSPLDSHQNTLQSTHHHQQQQQQQQQQHHHQQQQQQQQQQQPHQSRDFPIRPPYPPFASSIHDNKNLIE